MDSCLFPPDGSLTEIRPPKPKSGFPNPDRWVSKVGRNYCGIVWDIITRLGSAVRVFIRKPLRSSERIFTSDQSCNRCTRYIESAPVHHLALGRAVQASVVKAPTRRRAFPVPEWRSDK